MTPLITTTPPNPEQIERSKSLSEREELARISTADLMDGCGEAAFC
jgi:hypothetical protein